MTGPPPPGMPPRGMPNRPPLPLPISLGMMPLDQRLTEGAAINCAFGRVFSPVLATSLVSIELNGYELVPVRWGRIEVPVLPGRYHFRVFIRNGPEIKHLAEMDAEVAPGSLLELNYAFGGFGGPTLTRSATAEENRRTLFWLLGAMVVGWGLLLVYLFFG